MSKSLKHYKKQHNKSRRLRKRKGGKGYSATKLDLDQLKREMKGGRHLFAVHSRDSCIHCKRFKPEWDEIVKRLTPHPRLTVANLGPEETDFMNNEFYSKHNYGVSGVPTVVYVVDKAPPHEYHGEHTADKIIKWLKKTMKENNLELTIKPKSDEVVEQPVSFEQPAEVPESQGDEQLEAPSSESAPESAPASEESAPALEPASEESVPEVQADTIADAFPAAPLSPASIADTVSTKANELNDTLKTATQSATDTVSNAVSSATNAVSDIGNKLTNLFSSTPSTEAPAAEPVAAPVKTEEPAPAAPQVPSLVGGIKRRKMTRRKHRKSKSTRKSRKSRKSRK